MAKRNQQRVKTCWSKKTPLQTTLILILSAAVPFFIILLTIYTVFSVTWNQSEKCDNMCTLQPEGEWKASIYENKRLIPDDGKPAIITKNINDYDQWRQFYEALDQAYNGSTPPSNDIDTTNTTDNLTYIRHRRVENIFPEEVLFANKTNIEGTVDLVTNNVNKDGFGTKEQTKNGGLHSRLLKITGNEIVVNATTRKSTYKISTENIKKVNPESKYLARDYKVKSRMQEKMLTVISTKSENKSVNVEKTTQKYVNTQNGKTFSKKTKNKMIAYELTTTEPEYETKSKETEETGDGPTSNLENDYETKNTMQEETATVFSKKSENAVAVVEEYKNETNTEQIKDVDLVPRPLQNNNVKHEPESKNQTKTKIPSKENEKEQIARVLTIRKYQSKTNFEPKNETEATKFEETFLTLTKQFENEEVTSKVDIISEKSHNFASIVAILEDLYLDDATEQRILCSGVLISRDTIITTLNCLRGYRNKISSLSVRANSHYWSKGGSTVRIKSVMPYRKLTAIKLIEKLINCTPVKIFEQNLVNEFLDGVAFTWNDSLERPLSERKKFIPLTPITFKSLHGKNVVGFAFDDPQKRCFGDSPLLDRDCTHLLGFKTSTECEREVFTFLDLEKYRGWLELVLSIL